MAEAIRAAIASIPKSTPPMPKRADVETHAPYEAEQTVPAVSSSSGHLHHHGAATAATWRMPETLSVNALHDVASHDTVAPEEHSPATTGSAAPPSSHTTPNHAAEGTPSSASASHARPSASSASRGSAAGPAAGAVRGPGRHADPAALLAADLAPSRSTLTTSGGDFAATAAAPSVAPTAVLPGVAAHSLHTGTLTNGASGGGLLKDGGPTSSSNAGESAPLPAATAAPPTRSTFSTSSSSHATSNNVSTSNSNRGGGGGAAVSSSAAPAPTNPLHPAFLLPPAPSTSAATTDAASAANSHEPGETRSSHVNHSSDNNEASREEAKLVGDDDVGESAAVAPAASDPYARPAVALSAQLLELYKMVNARYCAQRRLESPGPKYNNGYDDKDGHYLFLPGEVIFQRYIAQEVLGKGSFGTVVRGFDQKRSETVAMKITRRGSSFRSQAKLELDILLRLNENPALNHLVVRLLKVFEWQGHLVLVFELLSFNLYQLTKCTRFNGVSLDLVRKFAYQLTHTLLQLESQKPHPIIHCDLKPENILLRNQNRSGIRLIDFGSACYTAKRFHRYIQSRFYRSPEVILFLEYGTAIDRWSLACVLVELHTGVPPFDGRTEAAQLAKFESTLGPIPPEMIEKSPKANRFYYGSSQSGYQLKEPVSERRTLESVIGVTTGGPRGRRLDTPGHDEKSYREFHDFVARFLRYKPEERMSCRDALQHPFLMPLYTSDLQQQQERDAQQQHRQDGGRASASSPAQPPAPQQPQPSNGANASQSLPRTSLSQSGGRSAGRAAAGGSEAREQNDSQRERGACV